LQSTFYKALSFSLSLSLFLFLKKNRQEIIVKVPISPTQNGTSRIAALLVSQRFRLRAIVPRIFIADQRIQGISLALDLLRDTEPAHTESSLLCPGHEK